MTYDSWDHDGVFQVHTEDVFIELPSKRRGLHYHNVFSPSSNVELMLINIVRENFEGGYTEKKILVERNTYFLPKI